MNYDPYKTGEFPAGPLAEMMFDGALAADPTKGVESWQRVLQHLRQKEIYFGEQLLPTSLKPHFIDENIHAPWVESVEHLFRLMEKLGKVLLRRPDLLQFLGFGDEAAKLFQIDPGYRCSAVIARPDAMWDGENLQLIELNTDSPAMMAFTDVVQDAIQECFPLDEVTKAVHVTFPNRTRNLLAAILSAYREAGGDKQDPTIAVVDWPGGYTQYELQYIAKVFSARGCPTFVCSPDELAIRNKRLCARGREIDIVQRRVLFPDFISRSAELETLVRAYREQMVVMVNPLRSYLLGNKGLLALFHTDLADEVFSADERRLLKRCIPRSHIVDAEVRSQLGDSEDARTDWVLKKAFGYGGHDVIIGQLSDAADWNKALAKSRDELWIAQRAVKRASYKLPVFEGNNLHMVPSYVNWNPWVFGGRFGGGTSRCSGNAVVSITQRGALLPTLVF